MSIYHPVVEIIKCDFCNEPAEKQCDLCKANFCIDCEPNRDDDAPIDACENCIKPPTNGANNDSD